VFGRGVARGVAYAYNNTGADRAFAAIAGSSETTPFAALTINPRPGTRPPNIGCIGINTGHTRVGRRPEDAD